MDIAARLQQIEELVRTAKSMPLSSSVLLNQQEVLEILEAAQGELPEEIKQARWVVKDREELLAKARRDGEAIVHQAQEERVRLLSREQVVKSAQAESERLLEEAREMARQIRLEAEDYVDAKLAQFEIVLERTLGELQKSIGQVRRGRDKLRGVSVAEEEFGTAEPEEQQ
ncbi:MAG: ATPase [Actinobacteria bacterium]|nr:MAG: ATPase [Actinomycetota bacterium]